MKKDFEKLLRVLFVENETNGKALAAKIGMSQQNLSQKMIRHTLRFGEGVDLLRAMGYRVYAAKDDQEIEFE